jgi:hypothetical protein
MRPSLGVGLPMRTFDPLLPLASDRFEATKIAIFPEERDAALRPNLPRV